ncbi:MAG TPA: DUF2197 domain-containing protein [Syntrophomonadaceae bacterium]|nr:DUF2197 domain-containing protein [Syntrophomonadaceae bacterium]
MEVRCMMCGKKVVITEVHKDYEKFVKQGQEKIVFFCEMCANRLQKDALDYNKPKKPI